MSQEWEAFLDAAPWFLRAKQSAELRPSEPPGSWEPVSTLFSARFPSLSTYLKGAVVTPVAIDGVPFSLFSRRLSRGGLCAWLSPQPSKSPSPRLHHDHRVLLGSFGGISEQSNAPESSWLLNHDGVLTEAVAERDGSFVKDYSWAFEEAGVEIPIELPDFYTIAQESNGNTTLCHRLTGRIVLFAPDHAFHHITPHAGCPEFTLYDIDAARTFEGWVNAVADQWLESVE